MIILIVTSFLDRLKVDTKGVSRITRFFSLLISSHASLSLSLLTKGNFFLYTSPLSSHLSLWCPFEMGFS
jgi:hypothetical protein